MCFCTVTSMAYQIIRGAIRSGIKTHGSTVPPQAMQVSPQEGEGSHQCAKCLVPYSCLLQKMALQEAGWSLFPVWSKGSCLSWGQPMPYRPPPWEPGSLRKQLSPHVGSLHDAGASAELLDSCRKHPFT